MNTGLFPNQQSQNPAAVPGGAAPSAFEPTVLLDRISQDIDRELRPAAPSFDGFLAGKTLAEIERRAIIATIRACKGNKAASARSLGISEKSIYNKMKRLQISNADIFANL